MALVLYENKINKLFNEKKYDDIKKIYIQSVIQENIHYLKEIEKNINRKNIFKFNFNEMKINNKIHNFFIGLNYHYLNIHNKGNNKKYKLLLKYYFKKYSKINYDYIANYYYDIKNNKYVYYIKLNKDNYNLYVYNICENYDKSKKHKVIAIIEIKFNDKYSDYEEEYIYQEDFIYLIFFILNKK